MMSQAKRSEVQDASMKIGFPSKTALSVAIRRTEHQLFDFPHVMEDPIAP
jgi:hypothetical protein